MGGKAVEAAGINHAPVPAYQENIAICGSWKMDPSRMEYHLRALAEIEEFASQHIGVEITIPSDLRESLPSAVETLLSRLESSSFDNPVRELKSEDLVDPGFGTLSGDPQLKKKLEKMPEGWDAAVRLLIMTIAGRCRTLELIKLRKANLTLQELKVLLHPLQASTVLRELYLDQNQICETKEGFKVLADFLVVNRSLRVFMGDDKNNFLYHYLAIHGHPTLESVELGYSTHMEDIARIVQACPNLQRLPPFLPWNVDSEQMVNMFSQVLIHHPSFRHVELWGPAGPVSSFLLSSCTGSRFGTSLTGLWVEATGNDRLPRGVIQPVFFANKNIEDICFDSVFMFSEEWEGIFRSLKQNDVLKRFKFWQTSFHEDNGFNGRAWDEFVALVKESSKLESLRILNTGDCQHDLCQLIEAVTSNKGLTDLQLIGFRLRSDERRALVSLIRKSKSLTHLDVEDLEGPNWQEFFNSLRDNNTLESLVLSSKMLDDQDLEALLAALRLNRALKLVITEGNWISEGKVEIVKYAVQEEERQGAITYAFVSTGTEDKPTVFRLLQQNIVLQRLYLSFKPSPKNNVDEFDGKACEALGELLENNQDLQNLIVFGGDKKEISENLKRFFTTVTSSTNLRSFKLVNLDFNADKSDAISSLIHNNASLTKVTVVGGSRVNWEKVFRSLRYNVALQSLKLDGIETLDDGAFKELLAALQVNSSLEKIDLEGTNWRREGKTAIIRDALEQKGRRENYMATMRARLGQGEFRVPNTGRLFLCGCPNAGKTRLRMALTQVARDRENSGGFIRRGVEKLKNLRRTEGIEIEHMSIDSLEISIWDLAGQDLFRALQDLLFPKLNLACVFLFVFSPFDRESKCLKRAPSDELHREFLTWLRFIASNYKITGQILPQVKVVITHLDKMKDPRLQWAEDVVTSLRLQFADIIHIERKLFCVNHKRRGKYIDAVLDHVQQSFHHVLNNKLFKVPNTCLELGRTLMRRSMQFQSKVKSEPVLSTCAFYELCKEEAGSLSKVNQVDTEDVKLLTAVTQYLHDAGNVIQFAKSNLVVVHPNWFTFSFMGRLVGAGHEFQNPLVQIDRCTNRKDGLISRPDFQQVLENFAQILREEGYSGVEMETLENLMKEMDLCFFAESNQGQPTSGYFAPAVFAEGGHKRSSQGLRQLPPWRRVAEKSNMGHEIVFVGVRVQCLDRKKTTLTPAFFPRFQIYFRNFLILRRGLRADQIFCDYNLIYIIFDVYEMYVESDGNEGDHIDVLVRSPNSRSETFKFVHQNVVREIQDFCASSKGVALVVGTLRTDCVRELTLSAHRDEHQAILIEDLKRKWKEYILNQDVDSDKIWDEGNLANYHHFWPINSQAKLEEKWESARDLLTLEDFAAVLRSVKENAESLKEKIQILKDVEKEIEEKVKARSTGAGSNNRQVRARCSASQDSDPSTGVRGNPGPILSRRLSDGLIGHDKTQYDIWKLGNRMGEISGDIKEIKNISKDIQRDVKKVQCYEREILAATVSMNEKLDQLIGVALSLAKSEVPSRPYLTRGDVSWMHRISAAVYVGKALTLHFMCEERSGNHIVQNQPGYPMTVAEENAEVLRFLSVNSVRILWYLLKAGVHVAAGLGNVIPDLEVGGQTALLTATSVGTMLTNLESSAVVGSQMVDSQNKFDQTNLDRDCWQYLMQLFSNALKGRSAECFLLYRVRYRLRSDTTPLESSEAWLCKECLETGIRMNSIRVDG